MCIKINSALDVCSAQLKLFFQAQHCIDKDMLSKILGIQNITIYASDVKRGLAVMKRNLIKQKKMVNKSVFASGMSGVLVVPVG